MEPLIAEKLRKDPRVAQARQLLEAALIDARKEFHGVSPPHPDRKESYQGLLDEIARYRASSLLFPYLGSGVGRGPLVELADGSVKYDFISGIGVHAGHSLPELIDTTLPDTIMEGNLQQNLDSLELMRRLIDLSGRDHCFLSSSGAMANTNGLKIAFHHRHPRSRILAFDHCFAGRSLTLGQITDKPADRAGLPKTLEVDYLPFYDESDPKASTERTLKALRALLESHPDQYAVMFFELIQGEGGFNVGSHDFFAAIMEEVRRHGILCLIDEVQTFGRTSHPFAFHHFGLQEYADIVTIGKLSQVCATLYQKEIAPPRVLLSQTFTSSSSAIKGSLAIIDRMIERGHFGEGGRNQTLHDTFERGLRAIAERHPTLLRGPYGVGGMVACTPLDGSPERVNRLVQTLFERGLICFTCGRTPLRLRFLIPLLSVEEADIAAALEILEGALCS